MAGVPVHLICLPDVPNLDLQWRAALQIKVICRTCASQTFRPANDDFVQCNVSVNGVCSPAIIAWQGDIHIWSSAVTWLLTSAAESRLKYSYCTLIAAAFALRQSCAQVDLTLLLSEALLM